MRRLVPVVALLALTTGASAGFTPVISDGERVFLTGFQTVWAFDAKGSGSSG